MKSNTVLVIIAALAAGCLQSGTLAADGGDAAASAGDASTAAPAATSRDGASAPREGVVGAVAAAPLALYLHPDFTLKSTPPSGSSFVTMSPPVNGPHVDDADYPVWTGVLDAPADFTRGAVVTLYVTSSGVTPAGRVIPAFSDLPGLAADVGIGPGRAKVNAEGPLVLTSTEVTTLTFDLGLVGFADAGTLVSVRVFVGYLHAQGASEVRFLMGSDYPAGVASA